jgi:hypothetical protein
MVALLDGNDWLLVQAVTSIIMDVKTKNSESLIIILPNCLAIASAFD